MKKIFCLTLILITCFSGVSGCRGNLSELGAVSTTIPKATESDEIMVVSTGIYSPEDNIIVNYPLFGSDYEALNETIKEEIEQFTKSEMNKADNLRIDMDYEIMNSNNSIVSILFSGMIYIDNTPHPNYNWLCVTFSTDTNTLLELKDFVMSNEDFVSSLFGETVIDKSQFNNKEDTIRFLEENYTVEDLEEEINLWDFYISGDNIGVVIPTIYAMGGYSLLEVPGPT